MAILSVYFGLLFVMAFRNKVLESQLDGYGSQRLWYSEIYQSLSCGTESDILAGISLKAIKRKVFRIPLKNVRKFLKLVEEME